MRSTVQPGKRRVESRTRNQCSVDVPKHTLLILGPSREPAFLEGRSAWELEKKLALHPHSHPHTYRMRASRVNWSSHYPSAASPDIYSPFSCRRMSYLPSTSSTEQSQTANNFKK
ncbi:hypothetical protein TNIN_124641 [Trichonephila inaurata madagascariensis]|uniref:Uncharacterized protein n=1 Tax=Trichonephila inaurata madagascariensis TaxID=2747483 RepID=A0A8X6XN37_9ARAC|nr:hypothetical protein TNIN_124641 [Trichonephila inaurata madagascariensis]